MVGKKNLNLFCLTLNYAAVIVLYFCHKNSKIMYVVKSSLIRNVQLSQYWFLVFEAKYISLYAYTFSVLLIGSKGHGIPSIAC